MSEVSPLPPTPSHPTMGPLGKPSPHGPAERERGGQAAASQPPLPSSGEGDTFAEVFRSGFQQRFELRGRLWEGRSRYQHLEILDTVAFGRALVLPSRRPRPTSFSTTSRWSRSRCWPTRTRSAC